MTDNEKLDCFSDLRKTTSEIIAYWERMRSGLNDGTAKMVYEGRTLSAEEALAECDRNLKTYHSQLSTIEMGASREFM